MAQKSYDQSILGERILDKLALQVRTRDAITRILGRDALIYELVTKPESQIRALIRVHNVAKAPGRIINDLKSGLAEHGLSLGMGPLPVPKRD